MARNPVAAVRQLVRNGRKLYAPSRILHPLRSTSVQTTSPPIQSSIKPFSVNLHFSDLPFLQNRSLASSSGPSNIVLIKSEEGFKTAISKAQDGSSPAIFYFTAVWCGPCRVISPLIEELSGQYPHVTTYKVDVDEEGLGNTLSLLNITSVPTFHFFQNGKKAAEVVGADAARLKNTIENLYK
ncbi:thioredoxin O1, mitochondrial [Ziziphus jujuba]|uniref:Thioredoxin O1, mitochondrial n=1 Tax=Ziziphus jujuba TaxID=326968 RepID=A0A6P4A8Z0_ZIZJJ|nr:thioredoxin O1, mitochondrial [Ziziphus jujuba]